MPEQPVPVTMGSPRFETRDVRNCLVTLAWFPPGAVLEPHVHDRPTLATMLTGGFDLEFTSPAIRRARFSCAPGTIFTEPAGEKHANRVAPSGARLVVLQPDLSADALPRRCVNMLDRINHFRDGPLVAIARHVAREILSPDDVTPVAIEGLVLEMLAEAARLEGDQHLRRRAIPSWLGCATDFLHAHFREPVRIGDMACAAGVHPAHLAAVFRRVHRVPLGTYLRRLRLDWAAEQLLGTSVPISVIAVQAGYADQAHLTRSFKREIGVTPGSYRRARQRAGAPRRTHLLSDDVTRGGAGVV